MKKKFNWYLPPTPAEEKEAWDKATLSVDANVLLDLYRYHKSTRDGLLGAFQTFAGRLWLTNQAATEFVRARKGVIAEAANTFATSLTAIDKIKATIDGNIGELNKQRLVEREIIDSLHHDIDKAVSTAKSAIEKSMTDRPKYLVADPIFDQILSWFENSVGDEPTDEELERLRKEGERRIKEKLPPGFADADSKIGDRRYGDYFVWNQLLAKVKFDQRPLIFVTSEVKEDWWEIKSGQTLGPRLELLKEAHDVTGQRVYIYKTDFFLKTWSKSKGKEIEERDIKEIQRVNIDRSYDDILELYKNVVKGTSHTHFLLERIKDLESKNDQFIKNSLIPETISNVNIENGPIPYIWNGAIDGNNYVLDLQVVLPVEELTINVAIIPPLDGKRFICRNVLSPSNDKLFDWSLNNVSNSGFTLNLRAPKEVCIPIGRYIFYYTKTM